ncbi:Murein DD-endopeptidase MepM and murein hydrolase activator NlpD, contain LysM domain [Methylobacillus rhizosphaerae]|uniref:Murein DD-endopeptidase MepM and murein hydrolase activator NlpD, contain LysM domain n=1 Tax=Methylobacillus rhizosphaerae TaxID=551994 RepID=A0A238ZF95_9PROT|nr:peptidoglycan DD-metalloendopeptidase family protein [Methylobacillus rhizosphaerae]SNR82037.1 Murein DD-endopeptidase MepM and murein hydrolase activator NlpD, contain LysM domain [Methylobacillus rhizosphaerae]
MQQTEQSQKEVILTQNPALKERKLRLRWLLAISSLPLFGIITAFGIAPQTATQNIAISTIVENIALPEISAPLVSENLESQNYWQADQVRRDDTLASLMARLNIQNDEALEFLRRNPDASALASQLRPGRAIQAQVNADGALLKLQYQLSSTSTLTIERTDSGYQAKTGEPSLEVHNVLKTAEIRSSLFAATDAADIPDSIAIQMAEIFSSDIDFHSDLRKGDRFAVIYEAKYDNGHLVNTGQVVAAEFTNQGKTYKAVMYRDPAGKVAYYTPEGKSRHKSFLRSPLEFTRISSGFTMGRFHPILQRMRAHKGVDLAAPIGTRIKAPADGVVKFVGVKSGYGNVIYLQHTGGVTTVYGHLSRFASGLRNGMKVSQGDIIGFVGMTGMATGPHLHYEFQLNGVHRDPLKVALPAAQPIAPQYLSDFRTRSANLTAQLQLLSASTLAALD